nr:hypothetical protein [Tanacetum cinerariifolium]
MGRDTVQLETAVNTISHEYLLDFTSEYGILEALHPELPGPEDRIVDFPEGKVGNNRFFWVDERVFPTVVDWQTNTSKDRLPTESTYSIEAVRALDTHRTPIQKQPKMLLCLVGISRRYYLGDEVYPMFLCDDDRDMDLFNLIHAPKSYEGEDWKPSTRPHKVPLLTLTATRVIEMDDPAAATDSSGVPSIIERSPLDFAYEAGVLDQGTVASEMSPSEDVPATDAPAVGQAEEAAVTDVNAPRSHCEGIMLILDPQGAPIWEKVLLPYNWVWRLLFLCLKMLLQASVTRILCPSLTLRHALQLMLPRDPESENASSPAEVGPSKSVYRPEWGVTNGSLLDTPEACLDLVDHAAPPCYFSKLRHMHNEEFLRQYNVSLARQVAMGSQLRLRFEQEAKLLRKSVAQVALRDKRIQARELEIKNLEALLETEANIKNQKTRVSTLQEQVSGEEKLKAAFEEFKRYEDDRAERRCAELDARLDALSIDFDEELYPHMLTAITGRRWVIRQGLCLAVMKCGESLEMRQAFADVVSVEIAKL